MADNEKKYDLETTDEVKQGHAEVGKFNLSIAVVLTIVCVVYLILNFKP
ncbi:MAG: hypothetical protein V5783_02745 [Pontiella sp.]